MDDITCSCTSCEHHRSKANPTPGKLIPGQSGKCTRPEGLCEAIAQRGEPQEDADLVAEISEERSAELSKMQSDMALADKAVLDMAPVAEALGRIKTADFFRRVGDIIIAQAFTDLRNSKKYKDYPIMDEAGNIRRCQTIEDFCQCAFGKSYNRCYELAQNLHLLGSDLYESAERIGFRNKDYRALKALPAEEQAVVKQALESESKDEVLAILEDLAAKHQAEREAAKKEKADLAADLEARGKLLEDKAKRLERTEEELYKLKSLPKDADLELKLAREEEAVERLHKEHVTILAGVKPFFQVVSEILADAGVSEHTKEHAVFEVRQVCEAINRFLLDCSIPVDFAEIVYPEWMRDDARGDLEAGKVEEPNGAHGSW